MAQAQVLPSSHFTLSGHPSVASRDDSWPGATTATTQEVSVLEIEVHSPQTTANLLEASSSAIISDYFTPNHNEWHNAKAHCASNYEFIDVNDHAACLPHSTDLETFMSNMEAQRKAYTTFVMTSHNYTAFVDEELGLVVMTFIFRGHNTVDDQATVRETTDRLMRRRREDWTWEFYLHLHGGRSGALYP
ncbi:hypothetical protein CLAFUW4_04135 [Fulvia fulva]|uniref:SnoaL-like domain-containing protein n=1 Tax=Passalora fulva TaxID=5499 RepID=A0A9Q8LFZ5_PASFU|nr:uncharacterized protein CLAFUR5_04096 [Fulvia fulva]KAK4626486.1 hypothetical protein CLAFUR4_04121 [Fulvia fulva]KAK4628263.1 hypothetical protein CLAFUR0_04122 [Fulvia fulva]UJO16790.1 hypothetical protein CLAFUR5_04096 [Fulvia fulva]WPV14068.1 hypothetical protein CLAFUW4_04135 [Fulvia fulva]WPV28504.1 hypothetical protein CLAFUW7_04124 [Fulvia fulva]